MSRTTQPPVTEQPRVTAHAGTTQPRLIALIALISLITGLAFATAQTAFPQQPVPPGLSLSDPADSSASLAHAQALIQAERFTEAEAALRAYLLADRGSDPSSDPRSGHAHYLLAYALLRQNRPKESLEEYTRAAAFETPSAEDLNNVGQAYVLLNDFVDAGKWITRAADMDAKNPDIWYSLGRLRYSEQKYAEAAECFQKTLLLAPASVKAENNLGLSYEGLNRPDDAIAAYRQAIVWQDANPPKKISEQPLLNLATALLHQGKLSDAQPLLLRAVALAPEDPRIREQLGHLYLQLGSFAEAAAQLEAATRLDPRESRLHFLLGQAYRRLGRQQEAKEQFDLAGRLANPLTSPK